MAQRKKNKADTGKSSFSSKVLIAIWIIFITVIVCIFMTKSETIKKNFNAFVTMLKSSPGSEEYPAVEPTPVNDNKPAANTQEQQTTSARDQPKNTAVNSGTETAGQSGNQTSTPAPQQVKPQTNTPTNPAASVQQTTPSASTQQTVSPPKTTPAVQTRDRNIYYAQVDRDSNIIHSKVTRKIPVSDSPMVDALNVMLTGPTADELNRGFLNFIPKNTKILSAIVRGSTAYISFNENFLFNTFGMEGYVAQLRQIVWTVTEFQNVSDVQILIEGRRIDYIGEGIWIGSPIGRQSF